MKFKKALLFVIIILIISIIFLFNFKEKEEEAIVEEIKELPQFNLKEIPEDISLIEEKDIIEFLKVNKAAKNYIDKNQDFTIEEKTVLTEESILQGKQGPRFREIYEDLELEDNRYLKIILINSAGNKGLVSLLDFKTKTVPKAFNLLLIKTEVVK